MIKIPLEHVEFMSGFRFQVVVILIARVRRVNSGNRDDKLGVTLCDAEQRVVSLARKGCANKAAASPTRPRRMKSRP